MTHINKSDNSGLSYLYVTQALCDFSFYGIKSVFLLYAIRQLGLDQSQAITLFATFMTLCYATSLIGGTLADRFIGVKNAILTGGFLSFSGMLCFTLPIQSLGFVGLALISMGSGLLKPNLSTAVGLFFDNPRDSQKDKAYSIFYMAINLGNLLAALACGFISKNYGWNYGILLVATTLLFAIYIFFKKIKFITQQTTLKHLPSRSLYLILSLITLIALLYLLFVYRESFHGLMGIIAIASLFYLGKIVYGCNLSERKDVIHIIFCILLFAFFCSLFEQAGSSLMLFFENQVNREIMGVNIPASSFLSLNPLFVLILVPSLIFLSKNFVERKQTINEFAKFGMGFMFVGTSFLVLSLSTYQCSDLISPWWVVGGILIQTIGELLIVPIVLSTISKFSPPRFRSVMMSFWLVAIAYGHYFAGLIAQFSLGNPLEATATSLDRFGTFFFSLGLMPIGVAILLFAYVIIKQTRKEGSY